MGGGGECVGITYKAGRIGQKLKAKVKNRGFAKVFSWMLRKLKEEKKLVLSNSWRKRTHSDLLQNTDPYSVVQKTDCEHNHISMNPLKGRP